MNKLICFLIMIQVCNLNAQYFDQKYYFDNCKNTYKLSGDTCVDFEMKSLIYEKIFKYIPNEQLDNKSNLNLNLRIDSSGFIKSCFLTWKEGSKYFLEDYKPKIKKIENFNSASEVTAYYTISANRSKNESKIYSHTGQIFKVVEVMPSWDSCYFSLDKTGCAYPKLFDAINKNLSNSKGNKDSLNSGKIIIGVVIRGDGYIGEINIYKNMAGSRAEKLVLDALNKLKKDKMRFMPGFQRNKPIDVLLTVEYFFDPAKI